MNNNENEEYLNMINNYDNINLEDLEDNNVSVESIPIEQIFQNKQDSPNFDFINNDNTNNNSQYNISNIEEGPIKLIEFNKNNFKLNLKALDIIRSIKEEIIVVSIVGKARTGKSFLMNLLLNLNNINNNQLNIGFNVDSSINSCTKGIWLWNTPRQKPNSSAKIIFIDSEGTNSVDLSTKTYDSKIFALIILLSSLFIYNTNGNIDEQSISDLVLSTYLSNSIAFNTNTKKIIDKDKLISDLAPKFIWTLRDFSLEKVDPETGEEITSNEYLELCLRNKSSSKKNNQNNKIRESIIKFFKERECITLPRPVDKEKDLQNLKNIPFSELKSNFRSEFLILKKKVYETSKPKIFNGKKITGPILADLLKIFIDSINSGIVPNINTAWDNIILDEIQKAYEFCKNSWKQNIENNIGHINIKLLYDLKYIIISEFINVIDENAEIKYNKTYYNKFKDYKKKLDNEIQKEINKKILNLNKQNFSSIKDNINQSNGIIDSNISNNIYGKGNYLYQDLIEDYSNALKNINNNFINTGNDSIINLVCKADINITKNILEYMNYNNQRIINNRKIAIEKETKNYEVTVLSDENFCKLKNINYFLDDKYISLKKDLDKKNKEIIYLIGKYTKLVEKRDELMKAKDNNSFNSNGISIRNNGTLRKSKMKSNVNQLFCDVDTQACGCKLNENICIIF